MDVEALGQVHDEGAMLIGGIVQHQGDRSLQAQGHDLTQKGTHGLADTVAAVVMRTGSCVTAFQAPNTL